MSRALFSLFSESSELMELLVAGLVLRKESFFHQHPRTSGVSPRSHPAPASGICQNSHRQNRVFGKLFFFLHLKHSPFINRALNWKSGLSQWSSLWAPFADCEEWWEALSALYLNQKESEKIHRAGTLEVPMLLLFYPEWAWSTLLISTYPMCRQLQLIVSLSQPRHWLTFQRIEYMNYILYTSVLTLHLIQWFIIFIEVYDHNLLC